MRIAKHGDLAINELSGGYEIEHIPTGLTHHMSDGVDFFTNGEGYTSSQRYPILPGTDEFNRHMLVWLRYTNDLMEAYFPQLLEPRTHYIAMGGLRGCLPNFCDVYWDRNDAIEYACFIHDIGPYSKFRKQLKKFGFADLDLGKHGNEYMEVAECHCLEPWVHSDEGKIEW